jgi:hypothetical protein
MIRFPCPYLKGEVKLTDPDLCPDCQQRIAEVLADPDQVRQGDILYIDKCRPYAERVSAELPDEVVARANPRTGEVESLEVMSFFNATSPNRDV